MEASRADAITVDNGDQRRERGSQPCVIRSRASSILEFPPGELVPAFTTAARRELQNAALISGILVLGFPRQSRARPESHDITSSSWSHDAEHSTVAQQPANSHSAASAPVLARCVPNTPAGSDCIECSITNEDSVTFGFCRSVAAPKAAVAHNGETNDSYQINNARIQMIRVWRSNYIDQRCGTAYSLVHENLPPS